VSSRHTRSFFGVMLAVVFAFSAVIAVPASAKLTKHQKVHIRKQLRKQIKKNPKMIRSKHWLKRASLVDFQLPVTIKLRQPCSTADGTQVSDPPIGVKCAGSGTGLNQEGNNTANIDLGPSLGQRTIQLGGSLKARIDFADSFDGGALGNVKLSLLPDATKGLTTSSIPLLWNPDISGNSSRSDVNFARAGRNAGSVAFNGAADAAVTGATQGCSDFTGAAPGSTNATSNTGAPGPGTPGYNALWYGSFGDFTVAGPATNPFGVGSGLPGYPFADLSAFPTVTKGFLPIYPGIDDWNNIKTGTVTGNNDYIGPSPNPFPQGAPYAPGSASTSPADTVLRTNALKLDIATPGSVNQQNGSGPEGSENIVVGASGGEANLFGKIPGKTNGIDVTLSLATDISSIIRITDQDVFATPLQSGQKFPAGIFNCRQIWTGKVPNTIPGVHLAGDLRIAPAITKEGDLRIAKATIASPAGDAARIALAACLAPYSSYAAYNAGFNDGSNPLIATTTGYAAAGSGSFLTGLVKFDNPLFPVQNVERTTPPAVNCGVAPSGLVANSALPPNVVHSPAQVSQQGSKVSVAGDLTVNPVNVDVIIGDV
jgi:hypothetical protein